GALPTITIPMIIDGTTESSFLHKPAVVEINGGGLSFDGLTLVSKSSGSQIIGLDLANFKGNAINVQTDGNLITGNMIGTDPSGTAAGPGNTVGILLSNSSNDTIGGTTSAAANIIGFNTTAGIQITGSGSTVQNNLIVGNLIGTDSVSGGANI